MFKKTFRLFLYIIIFLLGFVALYLVAAFTVPRIGVNTDQPKATAGVEIYIFTNGVHTDLVLPIKNEYTDWSESVSFDHTVSKDHDMKFIAIGWGDKGFYLETPTWAELKFSVAFKAAFHLGTSAMHTTFYKNMKEGEDCKKIILTKEQYIQLVNYIEDSFRYDNAGHVINIKAIPYGKNDAFYEARRTYSLFYTCNTWTNNALKAAGQRACLWTPTDKGIFYQYR